MNQNWCRLLARGSARTVFRPPICDAQRNITKRNSRGHVRYCVLLVSAINT